MDEVYRVKTENWKIKLLFIKKPLFDLKSQARFDPPVSSSLWNKIFKYLENLASRYESFTLSDRYLQKEILNESTKQFVINKIFENLQNPASRHESYALAYRFLQKINRNFEKTNYFL